MPTGQRVRANNVYGTITDNPLLVGAVSFSSLGLRFLPPISGQHAVIVIDPKRTVPGGDPEIAIITSHLSMGTTATITRGAYGTVAREWPVGTPWAHVPIDEDYIKILTASTRPSNPFEGQLIYETDTDRYVSYDGTNWLTLGGARYGWHVTRVADFAMTAANTPFTVSWDNEVQDTPSNFTPNATTGTTLIVPTGGGGLWSVMCQIDVQTTMGAMLYFKTAISAGGITYTNMEFDDIGNPIALSIITSLPVIPIADAGTISVAVTKGSTGTHNVRGRLIAYRVGN